MGPATEEKSRGAPREDGEKELRTIESRVQKHFAALAKLTEKAPAEGTAALTAGLGR